MPDLYSLDMAERDRVNASLGGGLPSGSIVLLEGEHGSGKSVITQRFCKGLCEEGTHVTYVSTEDRAADFVGQMRSLSYDVTDHLLNERMLFLHADVDTHERLQDDDRPREGREMLTRLMKANVMWRSDVILVDGFDAILLQDPRYEVASEAGDQDDVIRNLISFFRQVVADGKTIVLTVNPEALDPRALRPLRDTSDVYVALQMRSVGQEVRRNMVVRKFAGMGEQVEDSIGFDVQSGRGLLIVTRTVT